MQVQQLSLRSPQQKIDIQGDWTGQGTAANTHFTANIDSQDPVSYTHLDVYKRQV